jgi:hypothetical protein
MLPEALEVLHAARGIGSSVCCQRHWKFCMLPEALEVLQAEDRHVEDESFSTFTGPHEGST